LLTTPRLVLASLAVALAAAPAVASPPKRSPAPAPGPAIPDPSDHRRIIGILDVRVDGVAPEVAAQFQANLEQQLDTKLFWLVPRNRMHELMANSTKWAEGCLVGMCLREIRTQTRADLVLLVAMSGAGTSFGWTVTLVRTDTGRVLSQDSSRCDVCTVNEAVTGATLATLKLLNDVPDKLPDQATEETAAYNLLLKPIRGHVRELEHERRRVGLTLSITGLVVAAAGVALYKTGSSNRDVGEITAAAGGGIAGSGVIVLAF
jgi:hypothetical protein